MLYLSRAWSQPPPTKQILASVSAKVTVMPASYAIANDDFTGQNKPLYSDGKEEDACLRTAV